MNQVDFMELLELMRKTRDKILKMYCDDPQYEIISSTKFAALILDHFQCELVRQYRKLPTVENSLWELLGDMQDLL